MVGLTKARQTGCGNTLTGQLKLSRRFREAFACSAAFRISAKLNKVLTTRPHKPDVGAANMHYSGWLIDKHLRRKLSGGFRDLRFSLYQALLREPFNYLLFMRGFGAHLGMKCPGRMNFRGLNYWNGVVGGRPLKALKWFQRSSS